MQWKSQLANSLRTPQDLLDARLISAEQLEVMGRVAGRYQFAITPYYASLIDRNDPHCPIRRQAIPSAEELDVVGQADPLKDLTHQPEPRLTHRYPNRVLLHVTPLCSMYCRYCFRKSLLNDLREDLFGGKFERALDYLHAHPEIEEVILSGGDPLMSTDETLRGVLAKLSQVTHLKRLRIHSRVPVTLPMRITEELANCLRASTTLPLTVVVHFNHPRELTALAREALSTLRRAGVVLLNQSVLLSGVNNSVSCLKQLCEELFEAGVLPYYLHHPDPAMGTQHFSLSIEKGLEIYDGLRSELPGYLVPRYVIDDVARGFKTPVAEYYRRARLGSASSISMD